ILTQGVSGRRAPTSNERDRAPDQEQPGPGRESPDGSRDAATGRGETFGGDGCGDDSHRAEVHDAEGEEDRHEGGAAPRAVEGEGRWRRGRAPCRQAVPASAGGGPAGTGPSRQQARRRAFHLVNWSEPAIRTAMPAAIGAARASAGRRISISARATPGGKTAIPNAVQTEK